MMVGGQKLLFLTGIFVTILTVFVEIEKNATIRPPISTSPPNKIKSARNRTLSQGKVEIKYDFIQIALP